MAVDSMDHSRRGAAGAELLSSGTLTGPHRSTFTYRPTMPKGNLLLPTAQHCLAQSKALNTVLTNWTETTWGQHSQPMLVCTGSGGQSGTRWWTSLTLSAKYLPSCLLSSLITSTYSLHYNCLRWVLISPFYSQVSKATESCFWS